MNNRYIYMDTSPEEADWPKQTYDLIGVQTVKDLAMFWDVPVNSDLFRAKLANANNYAWVDDAPVEIRVAIRAHKNFKV